jgi:succinyl-CoA synthetase alpha subunit
MIGSLTHETPVIVQGITGRMGRTHAALMRAYGTNIVGGTSARTDTPEAAGVPVFANCRGPGDRRRRFRRDRAAHGNTRRG